MAALLFVAGDMSQVGKTTVCLGLLASILKQPGFTPADVAYIKPATQCEADQLVARYCRSVGIACVPIGPIVYYPGFTRAFLSGQTDTSAELLSKAKAAVDELRIGRKIVIVDGVGYPAVGSICGVSNSAIASTLNAPVLLVGRKGVGDAVDAFNLNRVYFEAAGVRVLGAVFNKLPDDTSYYSLNNCKEAVTEYFQKFAPQYRVYGFLAELLSLKGTSAPPPKPSSNATAPVVSGGDGHTTTSTTSATSTSSVDSKLSELDNDAVEAVTVEFVSRVDVKGLLSDCGVDMTVPTIPEVTVNSVDGVDNSGSSESVVVTAVGSDGNVESITLDTDTVDAPPKRQKLSREEIVTGALKAGGCGG